MDCGKEFTAAIETGTDKTLNCIYWGEFDCDMQRYSWAYRFDTADEWEKLQKLEEKAPPWLRWKVENIPAYLYPWDVERCTVKSYWTRLKLMILSKVHHFDRDRFIEMWTCEDCKEEDEKEE